jgi:hypothetical protein
MIKQAGLISYAENGAWHGYWISTTTKAAGGESPIGAERAGGKTGAVEPIAPWSYVGQN